MHGTAQVTTPAHGGDGPGALSVADLAEYLGISERHAWYLISRGEIQSIKRNGRRLIKREWADAYLDPQADNTQGSGSGAGTGSGSGSSSGAGTGTGNGGAGSGPKADR